MTLSDINLDWIQRPDNNIPIYDTVCQAQRNTQDNRPFCHLVLLFYRNTVTQSCA